MNPYEQLIQDLIDGKIEKIDVKREELMAFREAWLKLRIVNMWWEKPH